ncbi:MAG TPA: substrate-binding domain-containing protein [Planctomycetota bacterium]|nr:substrate-binding domain-containing protein [Planctomycetota bacterium]
MRTKLWILVLLLLPCLALGFFTGCPSKESTSIPANTATPPPVPAPANPDVILATTTSVQDTGLLDILTDMFKKQTGYNIKAIAVGSGEAMAMGKRGDADVLLVHSPKDEESFMKDGFGKSRELIMTNYFNLVGPDEDPAGCAGSASAKEAFAKIADKQAVFVSRADNSGTHKKELSIWKSANITPTWESYIKANNGMGIVLQIANDKRGYTLTDRGTYLAFSAKGGSASGGKSKLSLKEMTGQDQALLNQYSVIVLNPTKFPKINLSGAEAWAKFLLEPSTQKIIGEYGKDKYGEALFYPVVK